METELKQDSFSIGTASTGGAVKVYFEDIGSPEAVTKIDTAIRLWKNAQVISGKAK